jgi:hypothetical protein
MVGIRTDSRTCDKHCLQIRHLRMKPSWLAWAVLAAAGAAVADEVRMYRCIGSNGEPSFSDRPCSSLQGTPAPHDNQATSPNLAPTTQTCPISADDLKQRIQSAFANRSAVSLSGLFLWDGVGGATVNTSLRDLARLVAEPLLAVDVDEGNTLDSASPRLAIRTAHSMHHVPQEVQTQYLIRKQQGCWWLSLP